MRVTYDQSVDAAYIYLVDAIKPGESVRQEIAGPLVIDYDAQNKILGIEVLGASKQLRKATLSEADNRMNN